MACTIITLRVVPSLQLVYKWSLLLLSKVQDSVLFRHEVQALQPEQFPCRSCHRGPPWFCLVPFQTTKET